MTSGVATAAAAALAGVFAWAGVAKLARPRITTAVFRSLDLPQAPLLARVVPAAELALTALLLVRPRAGGVAALGLLAAFSAFLATRIARGIDDAGCGCFGGSRRTRVAPVELVRNGLLAVLAVAALGTARPVAPALSAALGVAGAVALGAVLLALVDLRVNTGSFWGGEDTGPRPSSATGPRPSSATGPRPSSATGPRPSSDTGPRP